MFAAKSATALKKSLAVMCFLPFVGTLPPVMMGIGVVPYYDVADADQVILQYVELQTFLYWKREVRLSGLPNVCRFLQ